jgi:hypothetical protein
LIDSYDIHFLGAPPKPADRQRAVATFHNLILFLQNNGLTTRTILRGGELPAQSTELWTSDLTADGNELIKVAHFKWLEAMGRGKLPEDVSILAKALAQIRGTPFKSPHDRTARRSRGNRRTAGKISEDLMKKFESSGLKVYDKAKWHYEGDFPPDLDPRQAFIHTGMFAGWLMDHDMIAEDFAPEAERFKRREITGPQAYEIWDGGLDEDMLTVEGNQFAKDYYDDTKGKYLDDYAELLAQGLPSFYHVQDTWENYEKIKHRIDQRYNAWKQQGVSPT